MSSKASGAEHSKGSRGTPNGHHTKSEQNPPASRTASPAPKSASASSHSGSRGNSVQPSGHVTTSGQPFTPKTTLTDEQKKGGDYFSELTIRSDQQISDQQERDLNAILDNRGICKFNSIPLCEA